MARVIPLAAVLCLPFAVVSCSETADLPPPVRAASTEALFEPPPLLLPPPPPRGCDAQVETAVEEGVTRFTLHLELSSGEPLPGACHSPRELWVHLRVQEILAVQSPTGWVHRVPTFDGRDWTVRWWTASALRPEVVGGFVVTTSGSARVYGWDLEFQNGTIIFGERDLDAY